MKLARHRVSLADFTEEDESQPLPLEGLVHAINILQTRCLHYLRCAQRATAENAHSKRAQCSAVATELLNIIADLKREAGL